MRRRVDRLAVRCVARTLSARGTLRGMAQARLPTDDPVILDALAVLDDAAAATSMAFTEATIA